MKAPSFFQRAKKQQVKVCNLEAKEIEITTPGGIVFRIKKGSRVVYVKEKSCLPSIVEDIEVNFRVGEQPDVDLRKPDGSVVNTTIKNLLPYFGESKPDDSGEEKRKEPRFNILDRENTEAAAEFWRPNATQLDSEDEWMIVDSEPETPVKNRSLQKKLSGPKKDFLPAPAPAPRQPNLARPTKLRPAPPTKMRDPWAEFATYRPDPRAPITPITFAARNPFDRPNVEGRSTLSMQPPSPIFNEDPSDDDNLPLAEVKPRPSRSSSPVYYRPLPPNDGQVPRAVRDFRNVPSAPRVYRHISSAVPRCAPAPWGSRFASTSGVFPMTRPDVGPYAFGGFTGMGGLF